MSAGPEFQSNVLSVAEGTTPRGVKRWQEVQSGLWWFHYFSSPVHSIVRSKRWSVSDSSSHHPRRQIPSEILQSCCHITVNPSAKTGWLVKKSLSASPSLILCHINVTGLIKDHTHPTGCSSMNTSFPFKSPTVLQAGCSWLRAVWRVRAVLSAVHWVDSRCAPTCQY